MGKRTQQNDLPDQAYDARVTNLKGRPFNAPGSATGPGAGGIQVGTDAAGMPIMRAPSQWINRNVSNTAPLVLPALMSSSVRVLPNNPARTGMMIQNKDTVVTVTFSFGNDAGAFALNVGPGQTVLLDFTTPGDALYAFNGNAAAVQCVVVEFTRVNGS